jgi:hypothetical protein
MIGRDLEDLRKNNSTERILAELRNHLGASAKMSLQDIFLKMYREYYGPSGIDLHAAEAAYQAYQESDVMPCWLVRPLLDSSLS